MTLNVRCIRRRLAKVAFSSSSTALLCVFSYSLILFTKTLGNILVERHLGNQDKKASTFAVDMNETSKQKQTVGSRLIAGILQVNTLSTLDDSLGSFQVKFDTFMRFVPANLQPESGDAYTPCDAFESIFEQRVMNNFSEIASWAAKVRIESQVLQFVKSKAPRVFLAGLLHDSCEVMRHLSLELLKFVFIYGEEDLKNVFISIHESGSQDCTPRVLEAFKAFLDSLGVPNDVKTGQQQRLSGISRIDFLQSLRNRALAKMYSSTKRFDEVVFVSDNYFCAGDIVRLLRHTDASIKCGMDFDGTAEAMKFRDTWVAHDMNGRMFSKEFPYVTDDVSIQAMKDRRPFQVACCWNGLTVLRADVFSEIGARFRRSLDSTECHAAETELICHDFTALGHGKVVIDPKVTVAYTKAEYGYLSKAQLSTRSFTLHRTNLLLDTSMEAFDTVKLWTEPPSSTECASLDGHAGDHPDRSNIRNVNWLAHYAQNGIAVALDKQQVMLHSCLGPAARQCSLSGGKRIALKSQ